MGERVPETFERLLAHDLPRQQGDLQQRDVRQRAAQGGDVHLLQGAALGEEVSGVGRRALVDHERPNVDAGADQLLVQFDGLEDG